MRLRELLHIMEFRGTHTASLRKRSIHSLLPANIKLIPGPGCSYCVTLTGYLAVALVHVEVIIAFRAISGDSL